MLLSEVRALRLKSGNWFYSPYDLKRASEEIEKFGNGMTESNICLLYTSLLISFCCFGFIIQAQEFLIDSLHFHGDTAIIVGVTERRIIENHDLLLRYVSADHGKRFAQNEELRKRWLKQIKNKVLTKELKYNLKDSSILADRRFWIDVYFDKEGDVFTVVFEMEKCIYNLCLLYTSRCV